MTETQEQQVTGWIRIADVGVDSGQLMVTDPCYAIGFGDEQYGKVCDETLKAEPYGSVVIKAIAGNAAVFSSGFGDGCYAVWAKREEIEGWGVRTTEVRILMNDQPAPKD